MAAARLTGSEQTDFRIIGGPDANPFPKIVRSIKRPRGTPIFTRLPTSARAYIGCLAASATAVLAYALSHWNCRDPLRFAVYAALALYAGVLKLRLPGTTGTFSLNFVFALIGVADLSFPETVVITAASMVVQTLWKSANPARLAQTIFNTSSVSVCVSIAFGAVHPFALPLLIRLGVAAAAYFAANTFAVSAVQAMVDGRRLAEVWRKWMGWPLAYYAVGVATVAIIVVMSRQFGWLYALLVLPVLYLEYMLLRLDLRQENIRS
jgi:hypothetical protein